MKHLRLFLFTLAAVLGMSAYAQKDVTSQYITNATLSSLDGWTNKNFNTPVRGNNTVGYATECYEGWDKLEKTEYSLSQEITLPAGNYTLVNYSFFRHGESYNTDATKSLAFLKAGDKEVAVKTLGSISAPSYANSQAEGANVFDSKMYRNTLDFTVDADNTTIEIGVYGTFDTSILKSWMILGMFELIDNDQPATMDSPFDVTGYITNPGFEYRDMSGWTVEPAGYFQTQNDNQGFKVGGYYAEKWQGSGALPEGKMSQTITSLPAGYYKLTANLGGNGTYIDLNGKKAEWTADNDYTVGYVLAENEDLTITAGKTAEGSANWIHFDNFKLQFCGDVAKALEDLCAKVTDYQSKLPEAAYNELKDNVDAKNITYTDVDELLAAIDAVNQLYEDADALITIVESYNDALRRAQTAAATSDKIWEQLRTDLNSVIEANNTVTEQTAAAYTAAAQALNDAAEKVEKSIASYKIIAGGSLPDNSLDGWVCENTNTFHINTWSTEGNSDGSGMVTPFIENWVANGSLLGAGKVYYQLEGLNPGEVYYAQALVRVYNEASSDAPNGPDFFVNSTVSDMTSAGTTFTYNGMSGIYATLGAAATVGEDGILKLGVEIADNRNYNWVAFKNVAIQSMDDALQAAIDKVEAFYENLPAGVKTACEQMIDGYENLTTPAEYEAAIQALNTKADELPAIVLAYEKYLALKAYADDLAVVDSDNPEGKSAFNTFIGEVDADVNAATDQTGIDAASESLKEKMTEYANASNPTEGNQFDLTFMLTNPNLEGLPTWAPADGWFTEQEGGNSQVMTNNGVATDDGKNAFYEYWSENAANNGKFTLYQMVTLPEGTYNMSCLAFASPNGVAGATISKVAFFANDTEGTTITSETLAKANIEFVNLAEQEVKIGLKAKEGNQFRWMGIGYVELYKLPAKTTTIADTDTEAPAAGAYAEITYKRTLLEGLNTLILPFSVTKAQLGDNVKAVLEYQGTTSEGDGTVTLNFKEVESLSPNVPYAIMMTADAALPVFKGPSVITSENLTVTDTNNKFNFVGTYECWTKNVNSKIVNGDLVAGATEFKKAAGGNGLKAYRAYLKKVTTGEVNVAFNFDGEIVNGIEAVEILNRLSGEGDIYNLNGQKVNRTERGIYIINGKKVVVK